MTTPSEIRHYVNSEIERIELEKIAKQELDEKLALKGYFPNAQYLNPTEILGIVSFLDKKDPEDWTAYDREVYNRHLEIQLHIKEEVSKQIEEDLEIPEGHPWLMDLSGSPDDPKKVREVDEGPVIDALRTPRDQPWLAGLTPDEADQKRQDMKDGIGVKYNKGKHRIAQIIPVLWIRRLVEVLEYGCSTKYSMHNWKGLPPRDLLDSAGRHFLDVMEGLQDNDDPMVRDSESQLFHIYQAAWNLLAAAHNLEKSDAS